MKHLLKNLIEVEGLKESLELLQHYVSETLVWRHRASQLAEDILLDGSASSCLLVKASKVKEQLNKEKIV